MLKLPLKFFPDGAVTSWISPSSFDASVALNVNVFEDMDECGETTDRNAPTPYYRAASPIGPSAAQLVLQSQKVCDQELSLPEGVSVCSSSHFSPL